MLSPRRSILHWPTPTPDLSTSPGAPSRVSTLSPMFLRQHRYPHFRSRISKGRRKRKVQTIRSWSLAFTVYTSKIRQEMNVRMRNTMLALVMASSSGSLICLLSRSRNRAKIPVAAIPRTTKSKQLSPTQQIVQFFPTPEPKEKVASLMMVGNLLYESSATQTIEDVLGRHEPGD